MKDNYLDVEAFDDVYRKAVDAHKAGDLHSARLYFAKAASAMEKLADSGDPALKDKRKAQAKKLLDIACNIEKQSTVNGGADGGEDDGYDLLNVVKPTDKITFDDIIGLDEAKEAIRRLLIDPLNNPEAYKKYGLKAGGFILLEGPPGTGKTTFAKAAAHELGVPFAEVNANALVDSYIGKTGKNIDKLFREARNLAEKKKCPVVLFVDELDFLAQKRGGENKTAAEAVPTLIKQMDGFGTNADDLVLIAATNIKESLDTAVLSRFRNVINIPLPMEADRQKMFALKLKRVSEKDLAELDLMGAAKLSDGFSGRDITQVSLDFLSILAARDAQIKPVDKPLGELLNSLIIKRASKL
ncbi:MAG: ATP-binding protein [Clostridiales bacterium]|nr:ATP-binding protein [Clostridiales bacterium]